jgi:hypothetical protein
MFEQRLAGCSVAGIARELNERSVPCPSDVDPERNRHRSGGIWTFWQGCWSVGCVVAGWTLTGCMGGLVIAAVTVTRALARSSTRLKSVYVREDVLLSQLVGFAAERRGRDVGDRDEDDVRSRATAIVSSLKAAAT